MKTNLLKVMLFAAVTTFMAGCSQDESPVAEQQNNLKELNVVADTNDFANVEARATEDLTSKKTTFQAGDAIGVYVIENEKAIIRNMKLTLTNDKWQGTTPLYLYENATYLAYFPYSEDMTANTVTSLENLQTALAGKWNADQSTKEKYEACDAMTASVAAPTAPTDDSAATLSFKFSHVLSMIELNIPTRKYVTTDGYKYNAPAPLTLTMTATDSSESVNYQFYFPEAGDGDIRRIIVKPGTYSITGKIYDVKGWKPVSFTASATLTAGQYKGFKLTYTDAPSNERTTRDLKVGDYFYSDGSICPSDSADFIIPDVDNGCVGIIFSTTTSTTDQGKGWKNGYVISITDAVKTGSLKAGDVWYSATDTATWNKDLYKEDPYTYMDGYTDSQIQSTGTGQYNAIELAKSHNVTIPSGTSGWYLPSAGQLVSLYQNFGEKAGETLTINSMGDKANTTTLTAIKNAFTAVSTASNKQFWWTTNTGMNDEGKYQPIAGTSDLSSNKKIGILLRGNINNNLYTHNTCAVRPVFAF